MLQFKEYESVVTEAGLTLTAIIWMVSKIADDLIDLYHKLHKRLNRRTR